MVNDAAHYSAWRTADAIFGISLIAAFVLNYLWPMTFDEAGESMILHVIGAPFLFLGSMVIYFAKKELAKLGQPSQPSVPTTRIVTTGLYRYSRNPAYLGLALCYGGLGIGINSPWILVLLMPTLFLTDYLLIQPEERYLEKKFGEEFLDYKKIARRWV